MDYIKNRIEQLEAQLNDPEVLDQLRVEIKLEAYKECMQGLVQGGELSDVSVLFSECVTWARQADLWEGHGMDNLLEYFKEFNEDNKR